MSHREDTKPDTAAAVKSKIPKMLLFLLAAQFCSAASFTMCRTVFDNFLVDEIHVEGLQRGALEAAREVPGLLTVAFISVAFFMTESVLGALCMFVMAGGFMGLGLCESYWQIFLPLCIMSTGLHVFMPIRFSIILHLSGTGEKGFRLGQFSVVVAVASLSGALITYMLLNVIPESVKFKGVFFGAAFMSAIGALIMLFFFKSGSEYERHKKKIVVKRKYTLFYVLTFLAGCRRQIFITFAIFALVKIHGVSVENIAVLRIVTTIISIYTLPRMGRLIDVFGERKVLTINGVILIAVFLGYAYVPSSLRFTLYALFCLDSLCLGFENARRTYLDKIASREDIRPSLAFGTTINHILAIPIPLVGGWLWDHVSYKATFWIGVMVLLGSIAAAQRIKTETGQPNDLTIASL